MNLTDFVTIVLSVLAIVISVLTFIYTVFTGPQLRLVIGNNLLFHYTADFHLYIKIDVAFFNGGAQPGSIVDILGTISTVDGNKKVGLQWRGFHENEVIGEKGKESKLFHAFSGSPQVIIIPGRGAERKGLDFMTTEPFELSAGNYLLELKWLVGPKLTKWGKRQESLQITESDAQSLREKCVENASTRVVIESLSLRRMYLPKVSLASRLVRPIHTVFTYQHVSSTTPSSTPPIDREQN